jgi:hypothetical protein
LCEIRSFARYLIYGCYFLILIIFADLLKSNGTGLQSFHLQEPFDLAESQFGLGKLLGRCISRGRPSLLEYKLEKCPRAACISTSDQNLGLYCKFRFAVLLLFLFLLNVSCRWCVRTLVRSCFNLSDI